MSKLESAVGSPLPTTTGPAEFLRDLNLRETSDEALSLAIDCTLADFGLAEKYEHNAHLRPAIRAHLDWLTAERDRRELEKPKSPVSPDPDTPT